MLLIIIVSLLAAVGIAFTSFLVRAASMTGQLRLRLEPTIVGTIANFFDTLGIGSFAPTLAWMRFRRMVPDQRIPMTMLAGYTPPVFIQSIIFLILLGVMVEPVLLFSSAVALLLGGLLGVPLVVKARVWIVQMVVAIALILAAIAYVMTNLHMFPGGGTATGLPPGLMVVAIAASFGFGILLNFGIGNYAPSLIMFSLMGMDPRLCFPIMAAGAGLCGAGSSIRHVRVGEINLKIVLGLAIGGFPAVLIAALLVKEMPLELLRWLVIAVVLYTAAVMAHAAIKGRREHHAEGATAPVAA